MSIITQGLGIKNNSIITKGYGRNIEEIIVEVIDSFVRRVPGSSSYKKSYIENEKEAIEEYRISAMVISSNEENMAIPIHNEIMRQIKKSNKIDIKVDNINVNVSINKTKIEVIATIKSAKF